MNVIAIESVNLTTIIWVMTAAKRVAVISTVGVCVIATAPNVVSRATVIAIGVCLIGRIRAVVVLLHRLRGLFTWRVR